MMSFARLLMRLGPLVMLAAGLVWLASQFGWLVEASRWAPYAAGAGLLLFMLGSNIFVRRSSGVRPLRPEHSREFEIRKHK
ncbi:hypothetical protein [Prosthecobacter sp.]|uniref:hypothetical protein n=1 Tax=Prosthecobacter sp. TaxID=1965333 RepID=UPI001DA6242A|nr:hypothetical protein [Prosthecobacter sp.]MCB1277694.1 hypothetical protein [Prosthecobacter sp.]